MVQSVCVCVLRALRPLDPLYVSQCVRLTDPLFQEQKRMRDRQQQLSPGCT
jgi:hypothetical protein